MAFNIAAFREAFPEFADLGKYPPGVVEYWSALADAELSETRFGPVRAQAVNLLAAHYLAVASINAQGNAGTSGAVVQSKRVGDVSVTYDTSGISGSSSSAYGGSRYGTMLSQMMRRYGAGVVQL